MTPAPEGMVKVREARLRRIADRQGLKLHRSPRRDELALDYDKYWLNDADGQRVFGGRYGVPIDCIEQWLLHPESR